MGLFPTGSSADIGDAAPADYWQNLGELLNTFTVKTTVLGSHRGINVAGAEFDPTNPGAAHGTTWAHENAASIAYLAGRGQRLLRIPFLWERLQPTKSGAFDAAEQARLQADVANAAAVGAQVILDVHNYGGFNGIKLGEVGGPTQSDLIDLWTRLSGLFKDNPTVVGYGVMNEPNSLTTIGVAGWKTYSQAVVTALRALGDRTCILVGGYLSSSLPGWQGSGGTREPWITDPIDNFRYEAHHYWDSAGGTYPNSYAQENINNASWGGSNPTKTKTLSELRGWIDWLNSHSVKGFIGEYGWLRGDTGTHAADAPLWDEVAEAWLDIVDGAGDLLWATAWATGSKWSAGYNLQQYGSSGGVLNAPLSNAVAHEKHKSTAPPVRHRPHEVLRAQDFITSATYWRGWSTDPAAGGITGVNLVVLGQVYATMMLLQEDGPLSNLIVYVGNSIVTPTAGQSFAAFFDEYGTQLAVSGDIGASLTATTYRSLPMTTPTVPLRAGQRVFGALLVNAATAPQLGRSSLPQNAIHPRRHGLSGGTGVTAMPATISPGSLTTPTQAFWMGAS